MPDLVDNIPDLLKPQRLRRTHLTDAIAVFTGVTENSYEALDQATPKADTISAVDDLIEAVRAMWPFADQAAFDAALDDLKTDQATAINAGITTIVTASKTDVFTEAQTQLDTAFTDYQVDGAPYFVAVDGRCGGTGRYPALRDVGEISSEDKHCPSCDGIGKVTSDNTPQMTWTATPLSFNLE